MKRAGRSVEDEAVKDQAASLALTSSQEVEQVRVSSLTRCSNLSLEESL